MTDPRFRPTFDQRGPVAIHAAAFGVAVDPFHPPTPIAADDQVTIEIRGPITQHPICPGLDSYDAIATRFAVAMATEAKTIVLCIGSPGGDVYGVFELARAMRDQAKAAGKRLVAYVDGAASSAAYALACAADTIVLPETGNVGSIGVIDTMLSVSRQEKAMGVDIVLISSGARKADGNPHIPHTEEAIAAQQGHVDQLASIFWAWVAENRKLSIADVQAMQAASFVGRSALAAGLVDQIGDFRGLREILADDRSSIVKSAQVSASSDPRKAKMVQASKYTTAMAALAALAEEGDEDAKKAMKKMLGAAKAETKDEPPAKDDKGDEGKDPAPASKAVAVASAPVAAAAVPAMGEIDLVAEVIRLRGIDAERTVKEERATLLASRPDLAKDPTIAAWLAKASIETVRESVANLPKVALPALPEVGAPTAGSNTGAHLSAAASESLKIRMGLAPSPTASVARGGHMKMVFGGTQEQVSERLAQDNTTK